MDEDIPLKELKAEAMEKGGVLAIIYFDAHGKERMAIQNALVEMATRLTKEPGVLFCHSEIDEAIESGEMYSSSSETKILTEDLRALLAITIKYGPIGVEVIEPSKITLDQRRMQDILLDVSHASQQFAAYIMQKTMTQAQWDEFSKTIKKKAEMGEKLKKESK